MVKAVFTLVWNPVLRLYYGLIGFPPGYLTTFQVWKMPDQNRISIVNCHNLNLPQPLQPPLSVAYSPRLPLISTVAFISVMNGL